MLIRLSKGLYHVIWYIFAAIVLTAAVLVTLVRLTLPDIGGYRDDIQLWVSQYMGYPVEIHNINADWEGWIPHLYLSNINLLDKKGKYIISHFHSAHLSFDPLASISHRQLVPKQLTVSGLGLTLTRRQDGSINITGESSSNEKFEESELAIWLLQQRNISIENAQVRWIDKQSSRDPIFFPDVTLHFRTYKDRLQINGSAILPIHYGNSIDFSFDARGNILTTQWSGTLYIKGKTINPQTLFEESRFAGIAVSGGYADISTWTDWRNARLVKFNGISSYKDFELIANANRLHIEKMTLHVSGQRIEDHNWNLNLQLNDLITGNGMWPLTTFNLKLDKNNVDGNSRYTGRLDYLKLDDVLPLLAQSAPLPERIQGLLTGNLIQGEMREIQFTYNPSSAEEDVFTYSTRFDHINFRRHDSSFSINGLAGTATGTQNEVNVLFDSHSVVIDAPKINNKSIRLSGLQGDISLSDKKGDWQIDLGLVQANTSGFPVALSGKINYQRQDPSPFADVILSVGTGELEKISGYLPPVVPGKVSKWIGNALLGGELISGDLVLRGYVSDFPFNDSEGRFKALATVSNATLDYHPDWPPVDNIDADIIFENDSIRIEASSGKIFNAKISEATATIDHLAAKDNHVTINGNISGHTEDAKRFINQSPLLKNNSLKELGQKQIIGSIELDLGLLIPFRKKTRQVEGRLLLFDTTFESELAGVGLENINGAVEFTQDAVSASGISALYSNHPVEISISRHFKNKVSGSNITLSGMAEKDFILDQLSVFFPNVNYYIENINNRLDGAVKWLLSVDNRYTESGKTEKQLALSSDLQGLEIDMPYPIGKTYGQTAPIKLSTTLLDSKINHLLIEYDSRVFADLQVDNREDLYIDKITVGLGKETDRRPERNGVLVAGNLNQLAIWDWLDLYPAGTGKNGPGQKRFEHFDIDVDVSQLKLFGAPYDNVNLRVERKQAGWEASIDSVDINGRISFPNNIEKETVELNLKRLKITNNSNSENDNQIEPDKIPKLNIKIDNFSIDDLNLGEFSLKTTKINNGISIDSIRFLKPDLQISGVGRWIKENEVDDSMFNLDLHADHIAAMLDTFGYSGAAIDKGETYINLDAEWSGPPMDFSLGNVNGTLSLDINKGQMLNLKPSAGRLFGLLSLQTLPRRLSLDFTDLFSKGFSFDHIDGMFTLENGNAYTNNLSMRGPSADIIVTGRTGLRTQDYDQIVTVTPQVSNSLPVASALFGPIGVGVGAVIFLAGEVFDSIPKQIDKLLRYQYSITGSWDDPVVEKIKRGTEEKSG